MAILPLALSAAEESPGSEILSLANLQQLVSEHGRAIRSFRLEGVVRAVVPKRRLVVLQDESATVLMELPAVNSEVRVGDRLAIDGKNGSLVQGDFSIQVGTSPVVDNDGHHPATLRTGKVFLPEGFQPVKLAWFNGVADAVLKLEWEGPGLQRQRVPGTALWRAPAGLTNLNGLVPGLNYVARNSDGNFLADFENQQPVALGVATNFEVSYRVQPEHTALFFNGYLKTPAAGIYTFYLTSDDGARLRVGESRVSCRLLPTDHALSPATPILNQTSGNSSWIELEGEVSFAGVDRENLRLDLVTEGNRVPVLVMGGASLLTTNLLHDIVRVSGICQFSAEEKKIARILVPSSDQVEALRSGTKGVGAASTNQFLTSVAQVKQLEPKQVTRGIPARIKGVLIGIRPTAMMLQDSTGGISIRFSALDWADQPHIGEVLEVAGVTGPGRFAPVIMAHTVRRLGDGPMPEPIRPRWDQLVNGSLDCVYVELRGILVAISGQELTLYTADGTIVGDVDGIGTDSILSLLPRFASDGSSPVGSLVRLRGCCMPFTEERDERTRHVLLGRIQMNCPVIDVEEAAPKDPFSVPARKMSDLLWFDPRASALQRTKLQGQVIRSQPGEYWALKEHRGFRILTSKPTSLQVGDLIEAVGFPKLDGPSPILQEAQIRKTGHAPLPDPVPVSADGLLDRDHDSTLIQVMATLVGETVRSHGRILELQAGPRHFLAVEESGLDFSTKLVAGSRLQLIGVYASASANRVETSTDPFSLLLIDGVGAVKVLERPSWWTAQHALIVAAGLAGALGMAFVWITLLRQKVEMRTAQLRNEIQERRRVEKDQAIEQERTRVAQDLHDELGAGLTTVGLLGELVKSPATPPEKKADYLDQITHSANALVTALDEIVWAVNPQNDSLASSANYYAYFAQPFLNAAGIACRLEIAESFCEHQMDPRLRHGVFLAFKEALNNVVRHSGATEVIIKILTMDKHLIIAIADDGHGIDAAWGQSRAGQDGMNGMRDRLIQLGGSCVITSKKGQGTTVEFHIPLPPPRGDGGTGNSPEHPADAQEDEP
jgi:signal transduction histidine kinase